MNRIKQIALLCIITFIILILVFNSLGCCKGCCKKDKKKDKEQPLPQPVKIFNPVKNILLKFV